MALTAFTTKSNGKLGAMSKMPTSPPASARPR